MISRLPLYLAVILCVSCGGPARQPRTQSTDERREAAYRANNRGVAFLEQYAHESAVAAFREALALDPSLELAHINLPIALFYAGLNQEAAAQAAVARDKYPDAPQPPYLLGLIARADNRLDAAVAAFSRVLELDPNDVGAKVNLALVYVQLRKYAEAAAHCQAALALEPYNATAAYNLAVALTRAGQREAGEQAMRRFQELRTAPYAITYSQMYLEQGRYAEAVASTGAEVELVSTADPAVMFTDATASLIDSALNIPTVSEPRQPGPLVGGVVLSDIDADGDLDIVSAGPSLRLLRNDRTRFVDVTEEAGLRIGAGDPVIGAVTGDFNNDTRTDVLLLTLNGPRLFAQEQSGRFRELDAKVMAVFGRQAARAAAFADVDHDGDLDVLIGGLSDPPRPVADRPVPDPSVPLLSSEWSFLRLNRPTASKLLRNNGDGTFADITAVAGLGGVSAVVALAPTDFDNRRDIDLLAASYDTRPRLFRNLRNGSFADVAQSVGLPQVFASTSLATGDVNKDGFTDAFFGQEMGPGVWALSDGRGRFRTEAAAPSSQGTVAAQIFDYDNDGLLDLVVVTSQGPRLYRNVGRKWQEQTDRAFSADLQAPGAGSPVSAIASGDLDLDGDVDIVAYQAGIVRIWRNDGGNRNRSLRVRLAARASNRGGVGSKVEIRAGSLHQKVETASATPAVVPADIVFGLGTRREADVVRVLWPSGILQAETIVSGQSVQPEGLAIHELDRKPSSCPYLFTWNGSRFEFVTDFMGGGEMGYWHAPGVRNVPDPDEYVRITDRQLQARDGSLEMRVTNELEEALFIDQFRLLAVTHAEDVAIFPDEGLRDKPRPFQIYATREPRLLAAAIDEHGHDVLAQLSARDGRYVDDLQLLPIRGYAREHAITLDVPPIDRMLSSAVVSGFSRTRTVLLLTGWTDYAFSSDNVAAHQAGLTLRPPALQIKDRAGRWQTVDPDIGIPVGRPQTIVVDISKFLHAQPTRGLEPARQQFRVVSNMRVYWDQIVVADATIHGVDALEVAPPRTADLHWRGFSAEVRRDGRQPLSYDYSRVLFERGWKLMPGRYTREGPVGELIADVDDRFVISRPGDELTLSFDASALSPLAAGARRTFLLHTVGYSKEMDLHSASPDAAAPIPFRAMSRYPYAWPERYPHAEDLERFHTRLVPRSIPLLVAK